MMLPFLLIATASATSDVLFIGNSYTTSNNLNETLAAVFVAAGDDVHTGRLAAGGLKLSDHAARAADPSSDWYRKLVTEADEREWVVLQDQSQTPGFPGSEPAWIASRDGALSLNALVAEAEAETMFFLTWGYRAGDPMNMWLYPDYKAMQGHLTSGYLSYAAACATAERPVWVAPVGPAFGYIYDQIVARGEDPLVGGSLFSDLYSGDGSHPARLGTQLAAYVFYASLTGESPVGLPSPSDLDAERVDALQAAAAAVVFDTTDAFVFPWEGDAVPEDTASPPTDTGESGLPEDTSAGALDVDTGEVGVPGGDDDGGDEGAGEGADEDADDVPPTGSSGGGDDAPGPGDYPATVEDDDDEAKGGCSHVGGRRTGLGWVLLPLLVLRRRMSALNTKIGGLYR